MLYICSDILFKPNAFIRRVKFKNYKIDEYTNKLGLAIEIGPVYSPWSNSSNERNHYSTAVIAKKIMQEERKATLQEAVDE